MALVHWGNRATGRPPRHPVGRWWAAVALADAAALLAAGCGSSSPAKPASSSTPSVPASSAARSSSASASAALKTAKIGGVTVVTNAKGFTLYWFAIDTPTKSSCNGSCTTYWPPVAGPATAGAGVTGTLGTIKRSDGSTQATYEGIRCTHTLVTPPLARQKATTST